MSRFLKGIIKLLHEAEVKVVLGVREVEIITIRRKLISMSIISTSLTVIGQPLPRFHVEAWLLFRNHEMDYYYSSDFSLLYTRNTF